MVPAGFAGPKAATANGSDIDMLARWYGRGVRTILVAWGLVFWCLPALAVDAVYKVVVNDAPPFRIIENFGAQSGYGGVYIDTIDEISRRTGLRFEFIHVPFARALVMMQHGQADIMLGPNWTIDRSSYMVYIDAKFPSEAKVFYLSPKVADVDDYTMLKALIVGVQRGSRYFEPFDGDDEIRKVPFDNYRAAFKGLQSGYVDAIIIPDRQGTYMLQRLGLSFAKASFRVPGSPSYITLSKGSGLMKHKDLIEKTMSRLNQEGFFERLMITYIE